MRAAVFVGLVLVALLMACDTKSPTGPSTVTVETPSPPTTTTAPPGPGTTTAPPTSTSTTTSVAMALSRTYVAFGPVPPTVPSQLTVVLQQRSAVASFFESLAFFEKQAEPVFTVMGFYVTPGGGRGQVTGQLVGTLDAGTYNGTLTAETPECTAEREYGGTLDPQFLRWTGGQTLRDCKGSPLSFNSLVMLATNAPLPTTTAASTSTTTTPLQCSFSLSTSGTSFGPTGGQATVGLTTGPTCGWTVQNFADWITVQPQSGSGSATIALTVAQGPPRSATVVIAGQPFVVNQTLATTTTTSSSTTTSTSTTTTSVVPLPDLVPVGTGTALCRTNKSPELLVAITNVGSAPAAPSFTRVYFQNGGVITPVDRITPGLAPNATTTPDLVFGIPDSCWVLNCSILIVADALGGVPESDEVNNSRQTTCDFSAFAPSVPARQR
jgi:CARDB